MNEEKFKRRRKMSAESQVYADIEHDNMESQNTIPQQTSQRHSYIRRHFAAVSGHSKIVRCLICNETFGNKLANLEQHVQVVHEAEIKREREEVVKKGRPKRSFVWNFCTRLDEKRALCHLCKKILYYGGGNTSNITKHLRRIHGDKIRDSGGHQIQAASIQKALRECDESGSSKERKSFSYVWKYCERLPKNVVHCNLCNTRMRFHGTANVISHLQRRHNILNETTVVKMESSDNVQEAATSSTNEKLLSRGSMVWKYIIRLGEDTVRCRVCLKILSYQGTSNLQRHLHRMHNIVWNVQESSEPYLLDTEQYNDYSLISFCAPTNDSSTLKCQMCNLHFEQNDSLEKTVNQHMIKIHNAVMPPDTANVYADDEDLSALYTEVVTEEQTVYADADDVMDEEDMTPETDDNLYDEFIEVEGDVNEIDEVVEQLIENASIENSISAQSGENVYSDYSNESNDTQLVTTTIQADDTQVTRELKENLLRQQAIYFSEKAGFYRMQKYLVAQQVRKERLEIEKLKAEHNGF